MSGNFKIYPKKINGILEEYDSIIKELNHYIKNLGEVKNDLEGAVYGNIKGVLNETEEVLKGYSKSFKQLRDGLYNINLTYMKSERKITGMKIGKKTENSQLKKLIDDVGKELENGVKNVEETSEKIKALFREFYKDPKAFIPQNIKNEGVLSFYETLRQHNSISEKRIADNAETNKKLLCGSDVILKAGQYIENQNEWKPVQFGSFKEHNMQYSGCEIIATYNALMALGEEVSGQTMVDLISSYERDGAALNGDFGVAPVAIADYFKNCDYDVSMTTSKDKNTINKIGEKSDTIIVTVYNNQQDITAQVHTLSITKEANGKYSVHNSYNYDDKKSKYTSQGGYNTLQDAINGTSTDALAISIIGISKPALGDFPKNRVPMA